MNAPLVIERTFHASADRVWEAITNKDQMKQWYFNIAEFKPEPGFEFSFEGKREDKCFLHLCRIVEVIPGKKLTYSWRYEGEPGLSFVTFELFPEGEQTRLKLTHEGLETFPQNENFAKENFVGGWTWILNTSLQGFLENNA